MTPWYTPNGIRNDECSLTEEAGAVNVFCGDTPWTI